MFFKKNFLRIFLNGIFFISSKDGLTKLHSICIQPWVIFKILDSGVVYWLPLLRPTLVSLLFKSYRLSRLIRFCYMGVTISSRLHLRMFLYSSISSSGHKNTLIFHLCLQKVESVSLDLVNGMWVKGNAAFRFSLSNPSILFSIALSTLLQNLVV